jgi:hypothetical protein
MTVQNRCGQFSVQNRVGDIVTKLTKLLLVTKKRGSKMAHVALWREL